MLLSTGRHRRTRTLTIAAAVVCASGAGGVYLGLSGGGAQAASSTVTVSTTAQLEAAVQNATAGTVIQVRGGLPTRPRPSSPRRTARVRHASPCGTWRESVAAVQVLPHGSAPRAAPATDLGIRRVSRTSPSSTSAEGFVATSSAGGVFRNLVTADNGDAGLHLAR
ncbi:putative Pectate lyase L [Streptomyces afghaniensis 772] [Streptomyces afghaniensis]